MLLRTVPFQRESSLLREDPERCYWLLDKAADILHACSFPVLTANIVLPYPALSGESNTGWGLRWVLEVFVRRKYELGRLQQSLLQILPLPPSSRIHSLFLRCSAVNQRKVNA